MKYKLAVGIPSYNEEGTIKNVVSDIDTALKLIGEDFTSIIINADNGSNDGTVSLFQSCETLAAKVSITTQKKGKGVNLKRIMEKAVELDCDGVIFIDSDLSKVYASWIVAFANNLKAGYDAVFSRRAPKWNGGDLTYHIAYPIIAQYWKANIHEPISGEFAFSRKVMNRALSVEWIDEMYGYGIDVFLTSIAASLNWCEVIMKGKKLHKLRSYAKNEQGVITMNPKFREVLDTVKYLLRSKSFYKEPGEIKHNVIGSPEWEYEIVPHSDPEIEDLKQSVALSKIFYSNELSRLNISLEKYILNEAYKGLNKWQWQEILEQYFKSDNPDFPKVIESLFFLRVIGFQIENKGKDYWYHRLEGDALK